MFTRILHGMAHVGLYGALVLGFLFVITSIFDGDQALYMRIAFGLLAGVAFYDGYKGADDSGESKGGH